MFKQCILTFAAAGVMLGSASGPMFAQKDKNDKGEFVIPKNAYWEQIKESVDKFDAPKKVENKAFKLDFSSIDMPKDKESFKYQWHNNPVPQGWTGTCWCFSTTSYMESEIFRLTKKKLKISEIYTVYWEYVEKAKRFLRERGNSNFAEGGETNGLTRIWKNYGCVPAEAYKGLLPGQEHHSHEKMTAEMSAFLQSLKASNNWNEDMAISTIKSILNHYLGEPPVEFMYNGKQFTPKEFLKTEANINMDDYVDIMSLKQFDYWTKAEYPAADNWWHSANYYNVPLDDFMNSLKTAAMNGYTASIGGDVSEAGYDGKVGVAVVPTFDIPSAYINEDARQFRFSNGSTGDDHAIHLCGITEQNGKTWFLIKDSGSGSRNNEKHPGYYFYNEDFVKLKMLSFTIHKDAVSDLLKKFK